MLSLKQESENKNILKNASNIVFNIAYSKKKKKFSRISCKNNKEKGQNTISMNPGTTFFKHEVYMHLMGISEGTKDRNRRNHWYNNHWDFSKINDR